MAKRGSIFKSRVRSKAKVKNASSSEATIYLYDEIDPYWGISAEQFVKAFNQIDAETIHIRINSPGGSVFDGMTIYNTLRQSKANTIAHIDGLAASIASLIAIGCKEVVASESSYFMIHNPWSLCIGDAEDMQKEADLLNKVGGTLIDAYAKKSKQDGEEISSMMGEETWMAGKEALDFGFVDRLEEVDTVENNFDLSVFANTPDSLIVGKTPPVSERDLERILRDAGYSRQQAKAIVADGFKSLQRDAASEQQRDVVVESRNDNVSGTSASEVVAIDFDSREQQPENFEEEVPGDEEVQDRIAELLAKCELVIPTTILPQEVVL